MILNVLEFYCPTYLGCPSWELSVVDGTYFSLPVRLGASRVLKHVNVWCFGGNYNCALLEEDLHVSVPNCF